MTILGCQMANLAMKKSTSLLGEPSLNLAEASH